MSQTAEQIDLEPSELLEIDSEERVAGEEIDSDEPEMESSVHYTQLALLVNCLEWYWRGRNDFFIGANLSVYYERQPPWRRESRGPDFFLVRNVERRPRRSWMVWKEGDRYPDLIVELLSSSTSRADRTTKKTLYQNVFQTPEYFWFSPTSGKLAGFHLVDGRYRPIEARAQGRFPSQVLDLSLGVQEGVLRFFDAQGKLLPTSAEAAAQEQARAEQEHKRAEREQEQAAQERKRAEREQERAERLAQRLRALGVDISDL
jgi:Uma2 family endonuclease